MKKLLCLFLAAALACSLAVPAAAADDADARLAAVTAKVKQTLDLDTEAYTEFYGDLEEGPLSPVWSLEWSGDEGYLSVLATEQGKILDYSRSTAWTEPSYGSGLPTFPAGDRESARASAQAFLNKVLTKDESVRLDEDTGRSYLGSSRYNFYGEILIRGLRAGMDFSISVDGESGQVVSFYRNDLSTMLVDGDVPSPTAKVTAAQAAQSLRSTLAMRLEYVLPEGDGTQAVLRYLPEPGDEWYVDAATGELVDLTQLYQEVAEKGDMNSMTGAGAAEDAAAPEASEDSGSLTDAEQTGVEQLEGVLDRDALDKAARAWTALGLDKYTLSTVNYAVDRNAQEGESARVTAELVYGRQVNASAWTRTAVVDARTGELLQVYSSAWRREGEPVPTVSLDRAKTAAEDFLTQIAPDQFAQAALYDSYDVQGEGTYGVSHRLTYAQQANGYFYADNTLYVGVDATDGSISSYEKYFDDAVTFDSPDGILTMDQAVDAWLDTYDAALRYVLVPQAIRYDHPDYEHLSSLGWSYLFQLVPGYQLEREDYLLGIDAKTGEPAVPSWVSSPDELTYDDLEGHWAKAALEELARYGVGWYGGSCRPGKELTQLDLVALVASAEGYRYDPDWEDGADDLYEYAYSMGLLERGTRDDDAVLTRAQSIELLLDAAGYGPIAQLQGIYRTDFTDDGQIPAGYYGYAALAQGLGVVSGGQLRPNDPNTRAEAAVMLYHLLDR